MATNSSELKLIVTGDFCPHLRIDKLCLKENYREIYNDALPLLKNKDISITNLECPLTLKNNPISKSGPNLTAHPKCIKAIKYGNFDVVTLANNHILDQNETGLRDTLKLCKDEGLKTVGAGENINEALKVLYINIKNKKLAILNFAEHEFSIAGKNNAGANPLNSIRNYYSIIKAKENADIVLIITHGGHEDYHLPSPRMVENYRFFADLGVTAIINNHSHSPSGYEIYNGVPIFYSLGNFIFDWGRQKSKNWYEGYFLSIRISNNSVNKINIFPYFQCKNKPGIQLMKGQEKDNFLMKIKKYSEIIKNTNLLETEWAQFCTSRKIPYLSTLFGNSRIIRKFLRFNFLLNFILKKKKLLPLLNIFRCQSHNEVMIKIMEDEISKSD